MAHTNVEEIISLYHWSECVFPIIRFFEHRLSTLQSLPVLLSEYDRGVYFALP